MNGLAQGSASPLPANLRQCAWIKGDLDSYIVTDHEANRNTIYDYTVTVDVLFDSVTQTSTQIIAGFGHGSGQYTGLFSGTKIGLGSSVAFNDLPISQVNRLTLSWANSNGILTCNGDSVSRSMSMSNIGKLAFFAAPTGSYASEGKIPAAWVLQSGNVVGELISVYDIYTGDIGMYDLIADKFYTNAGTGSFTKGADIT